MLYVIVATRQPSHPPLQTVTARLSSAPASAARSSTTTPTKATTAAVGENATPAVTRLRLTAARGSSWVLVRAGTSGGRVLYSGILNQGQSISVSSGVLWVSFGAAANLDARLNGSELELGTGTFDARIGVRGLFKVPFGTIRPLVGPAAP